MESRRHYRRGVLPAGSEDAFSQAFGQLAAFTGWRGYHTHRSDRSQAGFPDWTLVRGPRLVFAELKKTSAAPRVRLDEIANRPEWLRDRSITNDQASWLMALRAVQDATVCASTAAARWAALTAPLPSVEVYVWTPADWPEIERVLVR